MKTSIRSIVGLILFLSLPIKAEADSQFSVFEIACDAKVFQFSYGIRWNMLFLDDAYRKQLHLDEVPSKVFFPSSGATNDWIKHTCMVQGDDGQDGYQDAKYELSYRQIGGGTYGSPPISASVLNFDVLIKVKVNDELIIPEIALFKQCFLKDSPKKDLGDMADKDSIRMTFIKDPNLTIYMTLYGEKIETDFFWDCRGCDDPKPYIPSFCKT